ncbi:hypothetical protein B0H13DRAFT_1959063 [Mycena leptocephala]|nr:hypothetical protein B0H13DRAFT_1959063 [Mycena leptocephala]
MLECDELAFCDFNLATNARNDAFSAATFYPSWSGITPIFNPSLISSTPSLLTSFSPSPHAPNATQALARNVFKIFDLLAAVSNPLEVLLIRDKLAIESPPLPTPYETPTDDLKANVLYSKYGDTGCTYANSTRATKRRTAGSANRRQRWTGTQTRRRDAADVRAQRPRL